MSDLVRNNEAVMTVPVTAELHIIRISIGSEPSDFMYGQHGRPRIEIDARVAVDGLSNGIPSNVPKIKLMHTLPMSYGPNSPQVLEILNDLPGTIKRMVYATCTDPKNYGPSLDLKELEQRLSAQRDRFLQGRR